MDLFSKWLLAYKDLLSELIPSDLVAHLAYMLSVWGIYILLSYFLFKGAKSLIAYTTDRLTRKKSANDFVKFLIKNKVYTLVSYYVPFIILRVSTDVLFPSSSSILKLMDTVLDLVGVILFSSILLRLLNTLIDLYQSKGLNKTRPIKGMVQFLQVVIFFFTTIICISIVWGVQLYKVLGSLGAASAILMLIFKDTITGLVAGMQISFNNMVKIGDWVSIDKYNADGEVIEINLASVKIQNWDKSISTIPAYNFVTTDSIRNWQGMLQYGKRRIQSLVYIDANSIKPYTEELDVSLKNQTLLEGFFTQNNIPLRETNLGIFRAYLLYYLIHLPEISLEESIIVQLQEVSKDGGLILQIYCFTSLTSSSEYSELRSKILEHAVLMAPAFGLHIFQNITGSDLNKQSF